MFNNVSLEVISAATAKALREDWLPYLDDAPSLPETHYQRIVGWGGYVVSNAIDPNTYFYTLTCDPAGNEPRVLAVMDVTHKLPNNPDQFCIKVMAIHVAPQYDFRQGDTPALNIFTRKKAVASIATELLMHAIDEMMRRNAKELKIYGNHQVNIDLFELLCADISEPVLSKVNLTIDSHNNWLVIKQRI